MVRLEKLIANVEKHRQLILDANDYIWEHAESGYREWETCAYLAERFEAMGYTLTKAGNIPAVISFVISPVISRICCLIEFRSRITLLIWHLSAVFPSASICLATTPSWIVGT